MNFSKTAEYALQIMSLMARDETLLYRADDLFKKLGIPYRYLRKLMTTLVKSGLIVSEQGKYGGYRIARPLESISLIEILETCGEGFDSGGCFFGFGKCALKNKCIMHDKWLSIRKDIIQVLVNTSLAEIKKSGSGEISPVNQMFH